MYRLDDPAAGDAAKPVVSRSKAARLKIEEALDAKQLIARLDRRRRRRARHSS